VWLVQPGAGRAGRLEGTRPAFRVGSAGLWLAGLLVVGFAGLACFFRACSCWQATYTPPRHKGGALMAC